MARRRALAHPVPARQTDLAIQLHGVNPPALPVTGKGRQTGRVLLRRGGTIPPLPWSSFAPPSAAALRRGELVFPAPSTGRALTVAAPGDVLRAARVDAVPHVFGAIAHFERRLISERTRDGIAAARTRGRTPGRPPLDPETVSAARKLIEAGLSPARAATQLDIGRATAYRIAAAMRDEESTALK